MESDSSRDDYNVNFENLTEQHKMKILESLCSSWIWYTEKEWTCNWKGTLLDMDKWNRHLNFPLGSDFHLYTQLIYGSNNDDEHARCILEKSKDFLNKMKLEFESKTDSEKLVYLCEVLMMRDNRIHNWKHTLLYMCELNKKLGEPLGTNFDSCLMLLCSGGDDGEWDEILEVVKIYLRLNPPV